MTGDKPSERSQYYSVNENNYDIHHYDNYERKNIIGSQNSSSKCEHNFCHQNNMKVH